MSDPLEEIAESTANEPDFGLAFEDFLKQFRSDSARLVFVHNLLFEGEKTEGGWMLGRRARLWTGENEESLGLHKINLYESEQFLEAVQTLVDCGYSHLAEPQSKLRPATLGGEVTGVRFLPP